MIRILIAFCAFLFVSSSALDAATQDRWYIEFNSGLSSVSNIDTTDIFPGPTVKFDSGVTFGGALGFHFFHHCRAEANISYRKADVDMVDDEAGSGELKITSLMANVYYDFALESPLKPYLGVGLGSGNVDLNATSTSFSVDYSDSSALAWSLMAGATYSIHENIDLNLGYRYLGTRDVFEANVDLHELVIGVRSNF